MRNWYEYVRQRLFLPELRDRRARDLIEEVATQLEDVYVGARSSGSSEAEADAIAQAHIRDWDELARALTTASRSRRRAKADLWAERASERLGKGGALRRRLSELIQDVRYVVRQVRTNPGYALSVTLTLAVGIGASVLVFSVFHAVILRPFPVERPDELISIWEVSPTGQPMAVSDQDYLDFRKLTHTVSDMAAVSVESAGLSTDQGPVFVRCDFVTDGYLKLWRVEPTLGRGFLPEEYHSQGEAAVAIISRDLWQTRFGGDSSIVGKAVVLNGRARTVVGVLPPGPVAPLDADMWLPLSPDPTSPRVHRRLVVLGRTGPGIRPREAREELAGIMASLELAYPEANQGWGVQVLSLREWIVGPEVQRITRFLLAAAGLLLLLSCAGASNLMTARATARAKEVTIRVVMGAGRRRLLSQFMVESLCLGGTGTALGVLMAFFALSLIRALPPDTLPRLGEATIDGPVLLFAVGVTVASAFIFGTAPAIHATRHDAMGLLKVGTSTVTVGTRTLRNGLLVGQVAAAGLVLIGAGLLGTSFRKAAKVDAGFDPEGLLLAQVSPPQSRYPVGSLEALALYHRLCAAVEALPGVVAAGVTSASSLSDWRFFAVVRSVPSFSAQGDTVGYRYVSPGYFRAMGIPVLTGQSPGRWSPAVTAPSASDGEAATHGVLVSRSLADELWRAVDPLGRPIYVTRPGTPPREARVSGVVGDIRDLSYPWSPGPQIYTTDVRGIVTAMTLVVRGSGNPALMAAPIRHAILSTDPLIAVSDMRTGNEARSTALAGPRLAVLLMGAFSLAALVLATVGVSGLTAFVVARQRQDIGIHRALGASKGRVLRMVLLRILTSAGIGTSLALGGGVVFAAFAKSLIFDVEVSPLVVYGLAATILCATCVVATLVPARRALTVDPARTLQAE